MTGYPKAPFLSTPPTGAVPVGVNVDANRNRQPVNTWEPFLVRCEVCRARLEVAPCDCCAGPCRLKLLHVCRGGVLTVPAPQMDLPLC